MTMLLLVVSSLYFYLEFYHTRYAKIIYGAALVICLVFTLMEENIWLKEYQNIIEIILSFPLVFLAIYKKSKELRDK